MIGLAQRIFGTLSRGHPQALALVVGFAGFFLLTTSRERPWSDGAQVYGTASALVERGALHLPFPAPIGRGGLPHSVHPLLTSLMHVPGAVVETVGRSLWRGGHERLLVFGSHLAPAVLGGVVCLLFFQTCLALGFSQRAARLATLGLGVSTIVWVYARSPWPPIVEAAAFAGFFLSFVRVSRFPDRRAATALAVWFCLLTSARPAFWVMLPGVAAFLIWRVRMTGADPRWLFRRSLWGVLVAGLLNGLDSYLRRGSAWSWIAEVFSGPFRDDLLMGVWGVFLSPGKSFFLYSPPLLLSIVGVWGLARRGLAWLGWAMLATVGPFIFYLAKASLWTGDWAWGLRYMVFATPVLLLPAAAWLDDLLRPKARVGLVVFAVIALGGVGVQVLGNALYWDHYIRVTKQAKAHWLGQPNRTGAFIAERGGVCDPCFEDAHANAWLPPFQPIEGHWWLASSLLQGHDWIEAEKNARWHRYMVLPIDIADSYQRARIDWWFLNFLPRSPGKGIVYLVLTGFVMVLGFSVWWRPWPEDRARSTGDGGLT